MAASLRGPWRWLFGRMGGTQTPPEGTVCGEAGWADVVGGVAGSADRVGGTAGSADRVGGVAGSEEC